jgi:F-type H+-transporting ATPase subunit gamma
MPSLKDFRVRIGSVKNTRKITSAMKMVAASKLRQAQSRAEAGRPYAEKMGEALARLVLAIGFRAEPIPLLDGTGRKQKIMYVVIAADRGLAGGFNSNTVREVRRHITTQSLENREISIVTVGRKSRDLLKREYPDNILDSTPLEIAYTTAEKVTKQLIGMYEDGKFDVAYVAFSQFKNVMTQIPTVKQIIPFEIPQNVVDQIQREEQSQGLYNETARGVYSFEPNEMTLLKRLIPQQIAAQLYSILLEVGAGEQAARMSAMDNATRNAGDMISRLTLQYNRIRQAYITKEVSEIVAGAEASA